MIMVKVKALQNLYEADGLHKIGEVFEASEERVKALGDGVEVVKEEKKAVSDAPKDKMIKAPKKKK